jgi:hypothetical protein
LDPEEVALADAARGRGLVLPGKVEVDDGVHQETCGGRDAKSAVTPGQPGPGGHFTTRTAVMFEWYVQWNG